MYFVPSTYHYPYLNASRIPISNYGIQSFYAPYSYPTEFASQYETYQLANPKFEERLTDYGPKPFVVNIDEATKQNHSFRTALWTGPHFQITLMSLNAGESIGLEMHPNVDQFLCVEQGQGIVQMGERRDSLNFVRKVHDDYAIIIPSGTWHNLTNTGNFPLKLYSIYAPPSHPFGTVHPTKAEAEAAEVEHHYNGTY
ncbi:MAG: cupin domain-containing protein [Solibacillus sp.]